MKNKLKQIIMVLLFLGFIFSTASAKDSAIEPIGDFGAINWVDQKITAKGLGLPPTSISDPVRAKVLATRAAVVVAQRNLLEVVNGVHIDSTTVVENWIIKDETATSKVKGVLRRATVENYKQLPDGSVEATVSIPLSGELAELLLGLEGQKTGLVAARPEIISRLNELEQRIKALENRMSGLQKISYEQEQLISLFQQMVIAWQEYVTQSPMLVNAAYQDNDKIQRLSEKIEQYESRLTSFSRRLNIMTERVASLESPDKKAVTHKNRSLVKYTGLIIDCRKICFRPCLKPKIYSNQELIYPGTNIDLQEAVRNGYVRYYRKISQAQKSSRSGTLPLTIKAKSIYKGNRSLLITNDSYKILKAILASPNNFLESCKIILII